MGMGPSQRCSLLFISSWKVFFFLSNPSVTFIVQVSVVYYESRKRDLQIRLMNEGRCDGRLKTRVEESTYLTYTGLYDKTN